MEQARLLIRHAELNGRQNDILIVGDRIAAIEPSQSVSAQQLAADAVTDAEGGALLRGLNDHHLHLYATAAAENSLQCGPPVVNNTVELAAALQQADADLAPDDWIRGIGFHESVLADLSCHWLDAQGPARAIRIQHRGGRMWVLNSLAMRQLELLGDANARGERDAAGQLTGRFIEADEFLRERMQRCGIAESGQWPSLERVSRKLAAYGIVAVTDTSPRNDWSMFEKFLSAQESGELQQRLRMMGDASLDAVYAQNQSDAAHIGEQKFHLLESQLPDWGRVVQAISASHQQERCVAFHCVTVAELAFAVSAIQEAGVRAGDRIEHASVTPPEWLVQIAAAGLTVVSQPILLRDRGDQYLTNIPVQDQPWLYRQAGFLEAGVRLAGSSDAPFGGLNPWLGMQAAVDRSTRAGEVIAENEFLTPEQALALYGGTLKQPGISQGAISFGDGADLILLDRNWQRARENLGEVSVRLTLRGGDVIHQF